MTLIDLYSTSNLLRYISEWDPREPAHTKGGYMDGVIQIPNVRGKLKMVIQTYPAEDVPDLVSTIHPCLLHVVQIVKGRRDQESEPVPTYYHWKQEFEIEDGQVFVINKMSELDVKNDGYTPRDVPRKVFVTTVQGNSVVLGKKREQLNLILLQPKQQARAKANEATITKVLADRLGLYVGQEKVELHENFFKKEHARNLKRIRLKVDFYDESGFHCGEAISPQTIIDTGNKEIGSMDLYDVTPRKSCIRGGRKIIMVSEYTLAKGVRPIYQVTNKFGEHMPYLDKYLAQPDQFVIKNQTIIFLTPPQKHLQELENNLRNFSIKLLAKREGDGYTSNREFEFKYLDHKGNSCPFCDLKIDTDEVVQIEAGIAKPKPGTKKRKIHEKAPSYDIKHPRVPKIEELSPRPASMNEYPPRPASDVGYHSNSEFDYASPLTQEQLENLGDITEHAGFVLVEDDAVLHEVKEATGKQFENLPSENEVRTVLGMAVEEHWGHKEIKETTENKQCQNMPIEDFLRMYVPDGIENNDMWDTLPSDNSFGYSTWNSNGTIQSDSTKNADKQALPMQETLKPEVEESVTNRRKPTVRETPIKEPVKEPLKPEVEESVTNRRKPTARKTPVKEESSLLEDFPLLTLMFMVFLIIFNLIGEYVVGISSTAVIISAMTSAMFIIILKKQFKS